MGGWISKGRLVFKLLLPVYIAALAYLCFARMEGGFLEGKDFLGVPADKVAHFCMFAPFPVMVILAFGKYPSKAWKGIAVTAAVFLLGCVIAAGTEIGQSFLKYRSCDPQDFFADCLAMALSSLAMYIIFLCGKTEK